MPGRHLILPEDGIVLMDVDQVEPVPEYRHLEPYASDPIGDGDYVPVEEDER